MAEVPHLNGAWPGAVVVPLPAEVGAANAGHVGEELYSAWVSGASVVVADMTATTFCDAMGMRALARVHRQAATNGGELRLAVPCPAVRHAFMAERLFVPTFPSLDAALRPEPRSGMRRWWQGLTFE